MAFHFHIIVYMSGASILLTVSRITRWVFRRISFVSIISPRTRRISVAAATLTGCKNIASARKCGEFEVEVPSWGIRLKTAAPVRDDLKAVGIRAHYFSVSTSQNRFPITYVEEMEEPFELILQFRFEGQDPASPPIWWRIPKDRRPASFPQELGIAPVNILLLY